MPLTLSGSNGVAGVDGSAGTPALQGSDSNTGIAFGADTIIGSTGGSERFRCDSSGRLLVGASTARSNFSVGTPTAQFETAASNFNQGLSIVNNGGTGGYFPTLTLGTTRGTSVGSNTAIPSADYGLGRIDFAGADGTNLLTGARIDALSDGGWGTNDAPSRLVFLTTADGASSPTERMRIKNDGRIVAGDGFSTSYGQVLTAVKVGDTGRYFGIGDQGNGCNALSRDPGTTNFIHIQFNNGNGLVGTITSSGSSTAYNTSSDYRLKENIVLLTGATDRLKQIPVHRFNFIADPDKTVDGFIAHEAQAVVPECVTGEKDAVDDEGNPIYQGIDQSKLVPLLTAALQEAIAKIESLETRLAALEVTP